MSYGRAKGWQTKPKPGCFVDPTHPLSRGLVGCWLFNEGAGRRLTDYSGYGNHGVLTNMNPESDWVGSLHGGGLDFDGSNDEVYLGSVLNQGGELTISVFFLVRNFPSIGSMITYRSGGNYDYSFDYVSTGRLRIIWGTVSILTSLTSLNLYKWYHGVIVRSGVSGNWTAKIYLNGFLDGETNSSVNPSASNGDCTIGSFGSGRYTNGFIDDIRMYNRALNGDEIKEMNTRLYANILQPTWRKYFVPMTIGGNAGRFVHQYRQRRNFV